MVICEHCGTESVDEAENEVMHRGCRLRAAFPEAVSERGDGIIAFDMSRISESLGWRTWVAKSGLAIRTINDGRMYFEIPVQYGNNLSGISLHVTAAEWAEIVAAFPPELPA